MESNKKIKIIMILGDYVEDYEAMVPFQSLQILDMKCMQYVQIRKMEIS